MINLHTTHYNLSMHSTDVHMTSDEAIEAYKAETPNSVKLFPHDIVTMNYQHKKIRINPGTIQLYMMLWNKADTESRSILQQHMSRCKFPKLQYELFGDSLNTEAMQWYASVVLGMK